MKTVSFAALQGINGYRITMGLLIFLFSTLLACGGGGSGGDSGGDSSLTYSGVATQASLTAENTDPLVAESFQGALTSDSMVPFAAAMTVEGGANDNDSISMPISLNLQSAFADSLSQVVSTSQEGGSAIPSAVATETATVNGDCGGTATYNITYDENSGVFSGSFRYSGFCSGEVNISGSATFSGRVDPIEGIFDYFSFTFSNLTTTTNSQTTTVSGSLECDFSGSDMIITTDMVVGQSSSAQTCWLNNFTVQVTGSQMLISGRFYSPEYGYIDISTVEVLTISGTDQYPSSGTMEFTGAAGTKARLTAISSTYCRITADTDGDEIFEYDTGEILWSDL